MIENNVIEFKEIGNDGKLPASTAKEIVSFANCNGGVILFGYDDSGEILGVADADDVMTRLTNLCKTNIAPDILPFIDIRTRTVEDKTTVECRVAKGSEKPYYIIKQGLNTRGVYIRKGSSCHNASNTAIKNMILESTNLSWEQGKSFTQKLTLSYLQNFFDLKDLDLTDSKKRSLGLIDDDGDYTNLALLLSEQCPYKILGKTYKDDYGKTILSRNEFKGSILFQLDSVMNFLASINTIEYEVKDFYRFDSPDYPEEALREIILNAIVHRDYSYSANTFLNIYPSKIEVVSCGNLVEPITMESLFSGMSQTRNPMLANIFYRMDLIEGYGTGIQKIRHLADENKSEVTFKEMDYIFSVTITNGNRIKHAQELNWLEHRNNVLLCEGSSRSPQERTHESELNDIYTAIVINNIVTRKDIEQILNIKTTKAYMLLKELVEKGAIRQENKGRSSYYHI